MLTGDKQETAINIGYASKLLTRYTYYATYLLSLLWLLTMVTYHMAAHHGHT